MENFKINPFVAWFFLMAIGGMIGGFLGTWPVVTFCGLGIFGGGVAYAIKYNLG